MLQINGNTLFPYGVGTLALGVGYPEQRPKAEIAFQILDALQAAAAVQQQIGFVDLADTYCHNREDYGYMERLVKAWEAGETAAQFVRCERAYLEKNGSNMRWIDIVEGIDNDTNLAQRRDCVEMKQHIQAEAVQTVTTEDLQNAVMNQNTRNSEVIDLSDNSSSDGVNGDLATARETSNATGSLLPAVVDTPVQRIAALEDRDENPPKKLWYVCKCTRGVR